MSSGDVVAEAPVDQNAQATKDAEKMLAELQGESAQSEQANGTKEEKIDEKEDNGNSKQDDDSLKHPDRRNDRGRGRGNFKGKSFRENIKSDVTTQKESKDPVEIRKQVRL